MTFEWQSYGWGVERVKLSRQNKLFLCHFLALTAWCVIMFYVNRNKFHQKTDEHNKHMVIIYRQGGVGNKEHCEYCWKRKIFVCDCTNIIQEQFNEGKTLLKVMW